jgi:hypothetical protein
MAVKKLLASLLVCVAGAASSQALVGTITSHEEQLGAFYFSDGTLGYYGRSWTTQSLGFTSAGRSIFDVEADGKLGIFNAQLVVHCQIPELSHWEDVKGYVSVNSVPTELISKTRQFTC